jgi:hypothetical protein
MAKLAIVLAVPLALLATIASLGVVVVDVKEGGPNGHHIIVPVPLVLAQTALAVAPAIGHHKDMCIKDREALKHMPLAREVLEALADGPDGELVRVEEREEQVVITKVGRSLHVQVHGGHGEDVDVNVPLQLALEALPDAQGHFRTVALAAALGGVRFTDLVKVKDGNEQVHVYVW